MNLSSKQCIGCFNLSSNALAAAVKVGLQAFDGSSTGLFNTSNIYIARFWSKATASLDITKHTADNELLRVAMQDNIKLAMADVDCWVSKFMKCMVQIHVISQEALDLCTTIKHFL
jgi:hypothetical protein